MTSNGPATADRWAVSTRTSGAVLTAGVALPTIQLGILGIPQGFTPVEIQSWLRDLAGVALETSRADQRPRPIPALLHHALTGLLFSQSELWSHTGQALPCSAVFVDGPMGTAFGWVGSARVMLLVNGEPFEPQWVIVRDEAGREAMSAMLPRDVHVMLTLEYRPNGEDGSASPASMDAECGLMPETQSPPPMAMKVPEPAPEPAPALAPSAPEPINELAPLPTPTPAPPLSPLPSAAVLPVDQPGLAPDPSALPLDRPDVSQALPSTHHPSSSTFAMPKLPSAGSTPAASEPTANATGEAALTLTPATPAPGEPTPDQLPAAPSTSSAVWTPTQPPLPNVPSAPVASRATDANDAPSTGIEPVASVAPEAAAPSTPEPVVVTPPTLTPFGTRDDAARHETPRHEEPRHPVGWKFRRPLLGRQEFRRLQTTNRLKRSGKTKNAAYCRILIRLSLFSCLLPLPRWAHCKRPPKTPELSNYRYLRIFPESNGFNVPQIRKNRPITEDR